LIPSISTIELLIVLFNSMSELPSIYDKGRQVPVGNEGFVFDYTELDFGTSGPEEPVAEMQEPVRESLLGRLTRAFHSAMLYLGSEQGQSALE